MDKIWTILSNFVSDYLPSGIVMLGGFVSLLLSGGVWGTKYSERTKNILRVIGFVALIVGLLWTFLVAVLQTWDSYPLLMEYIWKLISKNVELILSIVISPIFLLVFSISVLLLITIRKLRIKKIEQGYKIQALPVTEPRRDRHSFREAYIQVRNVGEGRWKCCAELVRVTRRDLNGKNRTEIKVKDLNPDGRFLKWSSGNWLETIFENIPNSVQLIQSYYGGYTYSDDIVFVFYGDYKSQPYKPGVYTIQVIFKRWKGNKPVDFLEFEETLTVGYADLEWTKTRKKN